MTERQRIDVLSQRPTSLKKDDMKQVKKHHQQPPTRKPVSWNPPVVQILRKQCNPQQQIEATHEKSIGEKEVAARGKCAPNSAACQNSSTKNNSKAMTSVKENSNDTKPWIRKSEPPGNSHVADRVLSQMECSDGVHNKTNGRNKKGNVQKSLTVVNTLSFSDFPALGSTQERKKNDTKVSSIQEKRGNKSIESTPKLSLSDYPTLALSSESTVTKSNVQPIPTTKIKEEAIDGTEKGISPWSNKSSPGMGSIPVKSKMKQNINNEIDQHVDVIGTRCDEKEALNNKSKTTTPKIQSHNAKQTEKVTNESKTKNDVHATLVSPRSTDVVHSHLLDFFKPKERELGSEHDLLKMYEDGKFVIKSKGRQRLHPRRKKLTSLKKKVLEERLQKWKDTKKDEVDSSTTGTMTKSSTLQILGFCVLEEIEDDDEYHEIIENLLEMSSKVGSVRRTYIPRQIDEEEYDIRNGNVPVFVQFITSHEMTTALECWNGLTLGGQILECQVPSESNEVDTNTAEWDSCTDEEWQQNCLKNYKNCNGKDSNDPEYHTEVHLNNVLNDDDLNDEECMEESLKDIREILLKFGEVESLRVDGNNVVLTYTKNQSAELASNALNNMMLGGMKLKASIKGSENGSLAIRHEHYVDLYNVLTEDDLSDEECLEESIKDVQELGRSFGTVVDVILVTEASTSSEKPSQFLRVKFMTPDESLKAAKGFEGMVIGGQTISVSIPHNSNASESHEITSSDSQEMNSGGQAIMFSGDKVIPERFAECKRVPKIPNNGLPRQYASLLNDESVKPLLIEMLSELMRLQQRAVEEKNAKAKRRIVMGLREVARGIRSRKVKLVVMANNLDEYGAIDEKLQEIINLSHEAEVPIFYELNKRSLGKALGKCIKIAVAGIQNAEGAHQQFKKLVKIATTVPTIQPG